MKTLLLLIAASAVSIASFAWATSTAQQTSRKPSAAVYMAPKCRDMGALQKSTMEALGKEHLSAPEDEPKLVAGRLADSPFDQWTVFLVDRASNCGYSYAVFTDAGTCNVRSTPFQLWKNCGGNED